MVRKSSASLQKGLYKVLGKSKESPLKSSINPQKVLSNSLEPPQIALKKSSETLHKLSRKFLKKNPKVL